MIRPLLRLGRCTKYLPYIRGLGMLRHLYARILPQGELQLTVDDFDGDLKLHADVREIIGINLWHRPGFFEKNERKLFCEAIRPGMVVLDVGANVGIYTLLAAKRGATVFAIEPDPLNAEMLHEHIRMNGFEDKVSVIQAAASDRKCAATLFRSQGNSGHSNLFEGIDPVEVPCVTIDSLDLPPIDLCKMDIEGNELNALIGMEETIERSPNMRLLVEYSESFGKTTGLLEFMMEQFGPVYAVRYPPFGVTGPMSKTRKPPPFCNLWTLARGNRMPSAHDAGVQKPEHQLQ